VKAACGVVYKPDESAGTWTQTVFHAFTGGDDGSGPGARVYCSDRNGDIYGMTPTGGTYGVGRFYKFIPTLDVGFFRWFTLSLAARMDPAVSAAECF